MLTYQAMETSQDNFETMYYLDKLLPTIIKLLAYDGDAAAIAVLTYAAPSLEHEQAWDGKYYTHLQLRLPTHIFAQIQHRKTDLEKCICEKAELIDSDHAQESSIEFVDISPLMVSEPDWREKSKAWLAGKGTTNQGRVRSSNIASRCCDGLLFRSQPEIFLYQAFKSLGVTTAPLPVVIRGGDGYQRIEPDFLILWEGLIFIVEVDGDTIHQETPTEAHARTTILLHEGAMIERVKAEDCATSAKAFVTASRLVEIFGKRKAAAA